MHPATGVRRAQTRQARRGDFRKPPIDFFQRCLKMGLDIDAFPIMPKLKLEQLKPGMVVAAGVKNMDDMLLIPPGCELTERHLNILETWGIAEVDVQVAEEAQEPADPLSRLSATQAARLESEIRALFWELDKSNPVQQNILNLMMRRQAKHRPGR
jgi:hypothetical protein